MYKKNELKITGSQLLNKKATVELIERFCKRKAFVNSEHDYPFTIGFADNGEPIIKNLPDLGNTLIFGDTGKTHYHLTLLSQLLYVNYGNSYTDKPEIALYDDDMKTLGEFFQDVNINKCYIGDAEEFFAFLSSLEREKAKRQKESGKEFPYTIYFAYLDYHSLKDTCDVLKDKLYAHICDGLQALGLQLIVCAGNSRPTEHVVHYRDCFDTTIGTKTLKLPENSELKTDDGIITHKGRNEKFTI